MGTLFIIATPIGNLGDVSTRTVEVLRSLDVLFCEDTRVTGKLLARFEVHVPALDSYREEVHAIKAEKVIALLEEGKKVGLVTDAGTPCISDPGHRLVAAARERLPSVRIEAVAGPSAVVAALSVSGFPADQFVFLGFPPHKGRERWFASAVDFGLTTVFYESPHRVVKAFETLMGLCPDRQVIVARELTKLHEELMSGTVAEVAGRLGEREPRGEFVVVLGPVKK
jgi:16S rRNA (cytidine1402-2'-O)-methyltransferase